MKTFFKILLTLLILGGLGYGGWYAYNRYFAEVPQEGTVYVQSVSVITGVGPAGQRTRYSGVVEAKNVIEIDPDKDLTGHQGMLRLRRGQGEGGGPSLQL